MQSTPLITIAVTLFIYCVTAELDFDHKICKSHFAGGIPPKVIAPHEEKVVGLCKKRFLAISYNTHLRAPLWSAYKLTSENMRQCTGGRLSFALDEDLLNAGYNQADPKSPGFNQIWTRGHLAPSRAFSWNKTVQREVYYMSNIAMQHGNFNSGAWNRLEQNVFNWLKNKADASLYIITGVGYRKDKEITWRDEIAVPDYFFKMLCDLNSRQSAAFYGRNVADPGSDTDVFRSVREVEEIVRAKSYYPPECNPAVVDKKHWW